MAMGVGPIQNHAPKRELTEAAPSGTLSTSARPQPPRGDDEHVLATRYAALKGAARGRVVEGRGGLKRVPKE